MPRVDARRTALRIVVRGVVQGVGFRPYVFRLARAHRVCGWVLNDPVGVRIHVEGAETAVSAFIRDLARYAPPAAQIAGIETSAADDESLREFEIRLSAATETPTARISPDLPVCDDCLRELLTPGDRRHDYPYTNCTNCGPRFSIIRSLPYDRGRTTMAGWPLCPACTSEFHDPRNRRFHAQPVACPACGPTYRLLVAAQMMSIDEWTPAGLGSGAIHDAARRLRDGQIVAIKGIGGYHLACDADNGGSVAGLRERKFRKEKPFAVMARDIHVARRTIVMSSEAERLLSSPARPIVICEARHTLPGVAPGMCDLGVMLPYAPLHHLLFHGGAPERLVMTSGNRSDEPIAYLDDDATLRLSGIADAILIGERPIARRVDDSVVRAVPGRVTIVRRSRGYAPGVVARIPSRRQVLAVGADLKNTVTLLVDGQAITSQHIGDLAHAAALESFRDTIADLMAMYELAWPDVSVAHDLHPAYASTRCARRFSAGALTAVQHHRAHVASVLAERGEFDARVVGIAFDGTGYGDDGTIWGGEFFVGSIREGFARVAHLRPAWLPGGDAAARFPVQAAAGFLTGLDAWPELTTAPFSFPDRYRAACSLVTAGLRSFVTTSAGRLFDAVAALAGFTRPVSYEGQAAIWLEQLACRSSTREIYPMPYDGSEIDWRPSLRAVIDARREGADPADVSRAFHAGLAAGIADAARLIAEAHHVQTVVLSGGVFQNDLLLTHVSGRLEECGLRVLTNVAVPCNDGGISLGQAALAVRYE